MSDALCFYGSCAQRAVYRLAVAGTRRSVPVCGDHLHREGAKEDLRADFPGHEITVTYVDMPTADDLDVPDLWTVG